MSEDQKADKTTGLFNFGAGKDEAAEVTAAPEVAKEVPETATTDDAEDKGLFTEKNNSIDSKDNKLLDSVVATAGSGKDDNEDILNISQHSAIDTSEFIDQDYHLNKKASFAKGVFVFALFVSLTLGGYFYSQLNPEFELLNDYLGRNTSQTLVDLDEKVINTQTQLNELRYEIAKINLDDFSYLSDQFSQEYRIFNSDPDTITRSSAESRLIDLQEELGDRFETAKKKLLVQSWLPYGEEDQTDAQFNLSYMAFLKKQISEEKQLSLKTAASAERLEELDQLSKLVGNGPLLAAMRSNDFSEISYTDTIGVIDAVNSAISNSLSNVYKVKSERIDWSRIIREIDLITEREDLSYNNGFFEQLGGIQYTNYQFDSNTGRIIVTGQTKSDDGKNFTVMANLIDSFEQSPVFSDVTMRTFSKSGTVVDGYTSTIKLELTLQKEPFNIRDVQDLLDGAIETLSFGATPDKVRRKNYKVKRKPFVEKVRRK